MSDDITRLVGAWKALWNGDFSDVDELIAPGVRVHAALADGGDGSAIDDAKAMTGWVAQLRGPLPDLVFDIEVGPIVQDDLLALRWHATGTYGGGFPGAGAPVGTPVDFTGVDLLRVRDGQIVEYWLNSDMLLLLTQLRVQPAEPSAV
ncbi:ester cyclase [Micromonospora sp. DH14]|uniref:ester cyclase n=1 Tax=Micromonospora sp. DH14 TaxID=3040120 RepID=UPI002441897B|nr:ester cyclase [Micromonospora sp. DH14]MDG9674742.1 ester cyclase [Micromonospora sp. DH14]